MICPICVNKQQGNCFGVNMLCVSSQGYASVFSSLRFHGVQGGSGWGWGLWMMVAVCFCGGIGLELCFSETVYGACAYTQCVVTNEIWWPSVADCVKECPSPCPCVCLDWGGCDLLWPNGSCVPVPGSASLSRSPC